MVIVLFLVTLLLLLLWSWRRRYWSTSNLPPSPPRLPIIGNLHQLSALPHLSLHELSRKHGPIMYLQMGQVGTVVVSSPELAAEVLKVQDQVFADRPRFRTAELLMYRQKNVSFARYGEYWRMVKKVCVTELLSTKKVHGFRTVREEEVGRMLGRIRELCDSAGGEAAAVDLTDLLYRLSNGTIFRAATSCLPDGATAKWFRELVHETTALLSGFRLGDVFPSLEWIGKLTGMDGKLMDMFRRTDAFLDEVVDQHKDGSGDFVDVLLALEKDPKIDLALSKEDIKAIVMDMNAAGTDATYVLLEWTMSELLANPVAMSKAKQEISDVLGDELMIKEDDLPRLRYLKAILKESLRLHPPAPLLLVHESMKETKLHGYTVPAGTRVLVNAWSLGRDPQWWDTAEEFSPERFMGVEEGNGGGDYKGQDFRFLPFGSGRRSCPGMNFAMAMVELAVANLINQFDWGLLPGEEKLDMSQAPGLSVRRAHPLRVLARPRHPLHL